MADWDDWKQLDQGPFRRIDNVPAMVDCTSTAVSLFPNAIIPLGAIGFPINLFWPIDRHTTRLDWIYYAPPLEGTDRFDPDRPSRTVGPSVDRSTTRSWPRTR